MNLPSGRDVPKGAAITIVALVLLASVVMGRENPSPPPAVPARNTGEAQSGQSANGQQPLDIERLHRKKSESPVADLFALPLPPRPPAAAPVAPRPPLAPVAKPVAPPRPTVPPLPFRYLGRMTEDQHTLLIVAVGERAYSAMPGETIDDKYRLVRLKHKSATFVYLPSGARQTLALPPPQ